MKKTILINFNFQINFTAVDLFTANRMYIIYSCLYISTFTLNPAIVAYADPLSNDAIIVFVFNEKYKKKINKQNKEPNVREDKLLALFLMTAMKFLCRLRTIAPTSILTVIHIQKNPQTFYKNGLHLTILNMIIWSI